MTRNASLLLAICTLALVACSKSADKAPASTSSATTPTAAAPSDAPSGPVAKLTTTKTDPPIAYDFSKRGNRGAKLAPRPTEPIAPGDFCPLYADIVCRKLFACAPPKALAEDGLAQGFDDEPTCKKALGRFCGSFVLAGVEDSVKAKRVVWDAKAFTTCFQGWVDQGCTPPLGDLPATPLCRDASIGTVPQGGTCTSALDCAPLPDKRKAVCAFPEKGAGVCKQLGRSGDACELTTDCEEGLECEGTTCR